MNVYWLTFRIEHNSGYNARYQALQEAVKALATMPWWVESTSFIVFQSTLGIDAVAARLKAAIDPRLDMALVWMSEFKSARVIGNVTDADLFKLIPYVQRA